MMKGKDKWAENFRKQMEGYSEPLPDGLWEKLEQELEPVRIVPMWRTRRFAVAASLAVLVVSSLTVWFVNSPTADYLQNNRSVATILPSDVIQQDIVENNSPLADASINQNISSKLPKKVELFSTPEVLPEAKNAEVMSLSMEDKTEEMHSVERQQVQRSEDNAEEAQTKKYHQLNADRKRMAQNSQAVQYNKKERNRNWSVGVNTGNTPYGISDSFDGMARLSASRTTLQTVSDMMVPAGDNVQTTYNQILLNNRDLNPITEYHHKMPVTVGASVKWYFNEVWALETGLNYTLLVSELNTGSQKYRTEDEQKLHYVGIPLKLHRSIWSNRWFSLYASAGGMVEKCVSASLNTVYHNGPSSRETEHHSFEVHPLQWSVSAAAGAQVNFTNQLGLYVEPGVAYYFDDGAEVETIRKEHPFNFNLQLGLRFSFSK